MEKGIKGQGEIIVNESNTAQALGSGSIAVLSTPSMITMFICFKLHHLFIGYVEWFVLVAFLWYNFPIK